jgi:hypothetical protein
MAKAAVETKPLILLVLGMHRSGTSMVAALCRSFGLRLPADLMPANDWNVRGYFESLAVCAAHDKLLESLERSWYDPRPLPARWIETEAATVCEEKILAALADTPPGATPLVIKDPRATLLLPLWNRIAEKSSARLALLIVVRPAGEVAQSLDSRDGMNPVVGAALWWHYVTAAVAAAQDVPNAVVAYHEVLKDPKTLFDTLRQRLRIPLPAWDAELAKRASACAEHELRHHQGEPPELTGQPLIKLCDGLYHSLKDLPSVRGDKPKPPANPELKKVLAWFPEWRRLFAKHLALQGHARSLASRLERPPPGGVSDGGPAVAVDPAAPGHTHQPGVDPDAAATSAWHYEVDLSRPLLGAGWYGPELQSGHPVRWTGPSRQFKLDLQLKPDRPLRAAVGFFSRRRFTEDDFTVVVNGFKPAIELKQVREHHTVEFQLPAAMLTAAKGHCEFTFEVGSVFRPADDGSATDSRYLGVLVTSISFQDATY